MSKRGGGPIGWLKHKYDMYKFNSFIENLLLLKKN